MKIVIASDHAGYTMRSKIIQELRLCESKYEVTDLGCHSLGSCDFPQYANALCDFMNENQDYMGILICGSGMGMSMAANRHKHIRCALCYNDFTAKASRQHNNANILALGARVIDISTTQNIVNIFLNTKFEEGRHHKRINKINNW